MRIPVAVQEAVKNYVPAESFVLAPPRKTESSVIFQWGVRVAFTEDGEEQHGWICLGSESCRVRPTIICLPKKSGGVTSRATKHLKEAHDVSSDKALAESDRKRTRDEECRYLTDSPLFANEPARVRLLLETLRIVYNHLPYRLGEYDESLLLNQLAIKDNMQASDGDSLCRALWRLQRRRQQEDKLAGLQGAPIHGSHQSHQAHLTAMGAFGRVVQGAAREGAPRKQTAASRVSSLW